MEPIFLDAGASAASAGPAPSQAGPGAVAAAPAAASVQQVNVHPVVLFSILDQYVRREAAGDKVIGAFCHGRGGAAGRTQ